MPSGLVVRVGASWAVTGARALFAPGLLRQTAPGLVRHPVDLGVARPRAGPGAALDATGGRAHAALPPGRRVVALWGGRRGAALSAIPEICLPGEGASTSVLVRLLCVWRILVEYAVNRDNPSIDHVSTIGKHRETPAHPAKYRPDISRLIFD
jgi:hypothetical protein